jgi:hypothetical protein
LQAGHCRFALSGGFFGEPPPVVGEQCNPSPSLPSAWKSGDFTLSCHPHPSLLPLSIAHARMPFNFAGATAPCVAAHAPHVVLYAVLFRSGSGSFQPIARATAPKCHHHICHEALGRRCAQIPALRVGARSISCVLYDSHLTSDHWAQADSSALGMRFRLLTQRRQGAGPNPC